MQDPLKKEGVLFLGENLCLLLLLRAGNAENGVLICGKLII